MAVETRSGMWGYYFGNEQDSSNALTLDQMKVNAHYVFQSLLQSGFTLNAICGMLGNMQAESTINPGRWQSDRVGGDPSGHGYGLVQWTPYTKYTEWATSEGYDYSTMDSNLARINYEVLNGLQWIATSSYNMTFRQFRESTESPEYLAAAFVYNYERPASYDHVSYRQQCARYWWDYLGGGDIPPTPPTPGTITKKKNYNFVLFNSRKRRRING